MNDLDTRLRDALSARTAALPKPAEPDWDKRPPRPKWPIVVAALVLIAATAGILLRPSHHQAPTLVPPTLIPATPVVSAPPTALPAHLLDLTDTTLEVDEVSTGRVLGSARLPVGYSRYAGAAGFAADNRTFFAAVHAAGSPQTAIAEYHLGDKGAISPPRLVAHAPAGRLFGLLAVAPDATRIALTADETFPLTPGNASKAPSPNKPGQLMIWDLTTGSSRTFTAPAMVASAAWTADSRHLTWTTARGAGTLDPSASTPTSTPTSTLRPTHPSHPAVILPNGDTLDLLDTSAPMKAILYPADESTPRLLDQWTDTFGMSDGLAVDCTGTYALYVRNGVRVSLNLKTLQRTPIPIKPTKASGHTYLW